MVNNPNDLKKLFQQTSFAGSANPAPIWSDLDEETQTIKKGATLGATTITLKKNYEDAGPDCLLIQELIRLYKAGKLAYKTNDAFFR